MMNDFPRQRISIQSQLVSVINTVYIEVASVLLALILIVVAGELMTAQVKGSKGYLEAVTMIVEEETTIENLPFEIHSKILAHLTQKDVILYGRVCKHLYEASRQKLLSHVFVDGTNQLVHCPKLLTNFYVKHTVVSQAKFLKALQLGYFFQSRDITFSEPTVSVHFLNTFKEKHPFVRVNVEGDVHWMASHTLDDGFILKRTDLAPYHVCSGLTSLEIHSKEKVPLETVKQLNNLSLLSLYYRHQVDSWYNEFMLNLPRKNQLHTLSVRGIALGPRLHFLLESNKQSIERVNIYHPKQRYLGLEVFEKVYKNKEDVDVLDSDIESFNREDYPMMQLMIVHGAYFAISRVYGEYVDLLRE